MKTIKIINQFAIYSSICSFTTSSLHAPLAFNSWEFRKGKSSVPWHVSVSTPFWRIVSRGMPFMLLRNEVLVVFRRMIVRRMERKTSSYMDATQALFTTIRKHWVIVDCHNHFNLTALKHSRLLIYKNITTNCLWMRLCRKARTWNFPARLEVWLVQVHVAQKVTLTKQPPKYSNIFNIVRRSLTACLNYV